MITTLPYKPEAYDLFHRGSIALAQIETNGIRMDVEYLDKAIRKTSRKIKYMEEELAESDVAKTWRKRFGRKTNLGSTDQLGKILFEEMRFEPPSFTEAGRYQVDEEALGTIDHPFVSKYLEIKKLQKIFTTYLKGIRREVIDGYLHPIFNIHIARTFRSSSDSPNFQNIPVRNDKLSKLVRTAFIARPGCHLVEIDFSGIEVCIAACYHKDPTMMQYINDKTKDMHRDMAQECYLLPKKEMRPEDTKEDKKRIKDIRYCGKNMFVFPEFYGDWYIDCARSLWDATDKMKLHLRDGTPLKQHLKNVGIKGVGSLDPKIKPKRGTFEKHLQEVEHSFWNDRFPVYNQWRKDWVDRYQKKGYLLTKTGFICQGFMKRNEIINYPVQGSAFHCLLEALCQIVLEELAKYKMKTLVVGQIHDSTVADVPHNELPDYLKLVNYIMTKKIPEIWKWINVPLEVEAEVSPLEGSWADKEKIVIPN